MLAKAVEASAAAETEKGMAWRRVAVRVDEAPSNQRTRTDGSGERTGGSNRGSTRFEDAPGSGPHGRGAWRRSR